MALSYGAAQAAGNTTAAQANAAAVSAPSGGSSSGSYAGGPGGYVGGATSGNQYVAPAGTVSDSTSGANPAALAAAVKAGQATGSVDANGNYVPPATDSSQLTLSPTGAAVASDNSSTPIPGASQTATGGLQMPGGDANNSVYDPISGKQVSPSEAAFNALSNKGVSVPQDSGEASAAVTDAINNATPPPSSPTSSAAVDSFFNNNESIQTQAQQLTDYLSPQSTTDQLNQELAQINTDNTVMAGLNTQYMNIENVMTGTETDVRNEIQSAGGMATNSQVMALSSARNKVLLQQAKTIQQSITNQKNIIANDTSLYTKDKALAQQQYTDRTNALKTVTANQKSIDTAQKSGAALLLKTMGAAGVYASLNSDPAAVANFEQSIGWQPGDLQAAATTNQAGTVSTYQTNPDGTVSKITTKNGQPVSNVEQKPPAGKKGGGSPINSSTTYTTDAQGNTYKVTTKSNGASTKVQLSPNDPYVINQASNKVDSYMNGHLEPGQPYISPATYQGLKAAWVKDGHSAATFDSKFSKYADQNNLGLYRGTGG